MPAPLEPPVSVSASYVPAECLEGVRLKLVEEEVVYGTDLPG